MVILKGERFNTPYERGCVAATNSNTAGEFEAWDSDGVLCAFHTDMIERILA